METFGMKDGGQNKKATTTFGMIRRGNASAMEKMKPHFFRVMLDFMLQDSKIYIPTEFVKNYRSRLGSSATLKVANGDTWEVELVTDDDGLIWLVKGWEDFTNHHSLKQGDILVFRLDQNSLFQVMIFEPSASEKNYRCKDVNDLGKLLNDIKVEEECDAGKEKVPAGKLKEIETKKSGGGKRKVKLAVPFEIPNHPLETKVKGISQPRRCNASTSSDNPNFFITISEAHMTHRYMLLPTKFVYEHMIPAHGTMPESRIVMVSSEDGVDSWSLSFVFHQRHGGARGQGLFIGGWPALRRGNSLKSGDVCRFELISDGQMKVSIRRA
ncbi:unnamed protein product [Linum tenue]|uniref:TF-B3 domain-containing protein n=1 Tax=Linum tenue TaxID=586396 RepID=A0AAV0RAI3_9ROSI|nr:unnamed protein product [Linum tenue]